MGDGDRFDPKGETEPFPTQCRLHLSLAGSHLRD
ncbi:hypothetical protein MBUL_00114 [Methylobacterium bullatum]|uniref:Uncharacterized protein n=1 Tax=Methylobacterium bullatum TaxID=570505 RepID=A0A679IXP6_9HYPH|nr:hypothetical protein MBUL_00114 [Methylobacterium bullatum]